MKLKVKIIIWLIAILYLSACKNESIPKNTTSNLKTPLDSVFTPDIAGLKQAVRIKTNDTSKPIIL